MDSISASLLMTMATGAAGEAGRQLWTALSGLVRRGPAAAEAAATPGQATGEIELAALSEAPRDAARARALSEALGRRARQEPWFLAELAQWHRQAQRLDTGQGDTSNTISGGTQNGPVLQGRDFSAITFNVPGPGDTR